MSKRKRKAKRKRSQTGPRKAKISKRVEDPSKLERLPITYQEIHDYFRKFEDAPLFALRKETFLRIERITKRPLICYVAKTSNVSPGMQVFIDDSDLTGFADLIESVQGEVIDIVVVSNGGSAEASERIVRLLRERFKEIRFIVPANAYSAATLICFCGDEILMDMRGTLGPIDPQINGIPARAILRAFETVEKRLKEEGPKALTAYMPLISKYDLHILEICKSAQELSRELAQKWLSSYMLKCDESDPSVTNCIDFFSDYDEHKSHGRSIDRAKAAELGLKVKNIEELGDLAQLVRSVYNQYEMWFDKTTFIKVFENAHGINWGRQARTIDLQFPLPPGIVPQPLPQPGPPERTR
jgi:hypothetical protein